MKTIAILSALSLLAGAAEVQAATVSRNQALTVYAPSIVQTTEGARIRGAICRRGPVSHINVSNLSVALMGAGGAVASEQGSAYSTVLRAHGAHCGFYSVQTSWQVAPGADLKVCVDADGRKVCSAS